MEVHKHNYSNLLGELSNLEKTLEESLSTLNKKEKEKQELEKKYDKLSKEIENKNKEKEEMFNNNKIISIWKIVTVSLIGTAILRYMYLGPLYNQTKLPDIYISQVLLGCFSIIIGPSIISKQILKMVLKERHKKILKSEKYQNILEYIKQKEKERKNIEKRKKILTEECLEATINYSTQSAAVQIKKAEIQRINSTLNDVMSNNIQSEQITKPYTRVKIK